MKDTRYNYTFEPGRLYPHEIAVLSKGCTSLFFPTSFFYDNAGITAVYDCSGFKPLSGFRIEHTEDIFYLLEKVLLILQRSHEYLFIPERILLSPETVFYRQDTGEVTMTYVPVKGNNYDLHRNILQFLIWIKKDLCDTFYSYLSEFAHRSYYENMDISDMLTLVGVLRRRMERKSKEIL